jgi:hypothetical protein
LPYDTLSRFAGVGLAVDVTIAGMGKFKPVRPKSKRAGARPPGGLPCVILVFSAMALVMLFLYFVMKHANG